MRQKNLWEQKIEVSSIGHVLIMKVKSHALKQYM